MYLHLKLSVKLQRRHREPVLSARKVQKKVEPDMGYRDIYKQNTERYLHLIDAVSGVYKKSEAEGGI